MAPRVELQLLLDAIPTVTKAYFVPPTNLEMTYPAIVYGLDDIVTLFADDVPYKQSKRYQVTLITRDPDSPAVDALASLPMCSFNRSYVAENLHHFVFTLFF